MPLIDPEDLQELLDKLEALRSKAEFGHYEAEPLLIQFIEERVPEEHRGKLTELYASLARNWFYE